MLNIEHLLANFRALEQTCRLRQLSGSGGKYFFQLAELIKAAVYGKGVYKSSKEKVRTQKYAAIAAIFPNL